MSTSFLVGAITIGVVLLYGCVGEIIIEKAGHLNLGIPGIMCMGTAGGCYGASLYMSMIADQNSPSLLLLAIFSILFSTLFAGFGGLIYAFFTVSLRCNQNITGLALTTFGSGFAQFFMDNVVERSYLNNAAKTLSKGIPVLSEWGWFGEVFFSHGILIYLAIAIAICTSVVFNKTKVGLQLRAVGESPSTADAAGINVTSYKYVAILTGSSVAGLGGVVYIMDYIGGSWEQASTIESFGWLSIALVIFTLWRPTLSIVGSIFFGGLYILSATIKGITPSQMQLVKIIPYVVTIIVLIITSAVGGKNVQAPHALGLNYYREDR